MVDVATGDERRIQIEPQHMVLMGAFREDGSTVAVLTDDRGTVQAYDVSVEDPARPIGPPLPAGAFEFSGSGDLLLAADCGRRGRSFSLDLRRPTVWQPVTAYCLATLSPDGKTIASSPDGRAMFTTPVDRRAKPEPLFDLATIEGLPAGLDDDSRIVGTPTWGEGGLAVIVGSGSRLAVVIVPRQGSVEIVAIGDSSAGFRSAISWEPGGSRLVVANDTHTESVVRALEPEGEGSVIALSDEPIAAVVWSPSSEAIVASGVFSWIFLDPQSGWIRKVPVSRSRGTPVAWSI